MIIIKCSLQKTFILQNRTTMKKQPLVKMLAAILFIASLTSCVNVKEYQKNKLNDSEMALSNRKVEKNELNFKLSKKNTQVWCIAKSIRRDQIRT